MSGFDIIGDVHAQGTKLAHLLKLLGYGGSEWKHPDGREAIFIGDLIDRGTEHAMVFDIVRSMGAKVIQGNHEFNATCYSREGANGYIRPRTLTNTAQHIDFLSEFPLGSDAHREAVGWFETFPVYVEMDGFRLTHACWHQNSLDICQPYFADDNTLTDAAYEAYDTENEEGFREAMNVLMKGPEFCLPKEAEYLDAHGQPRRRARLYWWKDNVGESDCEYFQYSQSIVPFLSQNTLRNVQAVRKKFKYASEVPVLFGHYNLKGALSMPFGNAACINFEDRIVAYRWNQGDTSLQPGRLVCV